MFLKNYSGVFSNRKLFEQLNEKFGLTVHLDAECPLNFKIIREDPEPITMSTTWFTCIFSLTWKYFKRMLTRSILYQKSNFKTLFSWIFIWEILREQADKSPPARFKRYCKSVVFYRLRDRYIGRKGNRIRINHEAKSRCFSSQKETITIKNR